jgi:hypothetical protein
MKLNLLIGAWLPLGFAVTAFLVLVTLWGIAGTTSEVKKELTGLRADLALTTKGCAPGSKLSGPNT